MSILVFVGRPWKRIGLVLGLLLLLLLLLSLLLSSPRPSRGEGRGVGGEGEGEGSAAGFSWINRLSKTTINRMLINSSTRSLSINGNPQHNPTPAVAT